jgi:acyl dehydratase
MNQISSIAAELKSKIGIESEPQNGIIERGMIKRFARAIGDPNPLWQDEGFAGKSQYGGIIAPPTLTPVIGNEQMQQQLSAMSTLSILHAGTELECHQPVREGDVITAATRISGVREQQGKIGKMILVNLDTTYTNQRSEVVATCRQRIIGY